MVHKTMKKRLFNKINAVAAVAVTSLVGLFIVVTYAAGSATLTLTPSGGSHDIGSNFTVTIYENSGSETVNSVDVTMTYDQAKLQFVSIDSSSSAFAIAATATGGGGGVNIAKGTVTPVTGSQVVASVTFKALAESGGTTIDFASNSHIVRSTDSSDIWNGSTTGGTYAVTTPAAPPTTTPTTSPASSSGTSTPSSSTTTPAKKTTTTATATPSAAAQAADPSAPIPVAEIASTSQSYLVSIKVQDSKGKIVEGATVTLNGKTSLSDSTGVAGFIGIKAGNYPVTVKSKSGNGKSNITVASDKSPTKVQEFTTTVKPATPWLMIEIGVGVVIVLAAGLFVLLKVLKKKNIMSFSPAAASPSVVTSDAPPPPAPAVEEIPSQPAAFLSTPSAPASPGTVVQPQSPAEK
jgi:hypothetical protein